MNKPRFLLFDACVAIDFLDLNCDFVALVSETLGQVCIARPLLEELKGRVNAENAAQLGIEIVDVDEEDVLTVLERENAPKGDDAWGRLSNYDVLCLLTARRGRYVCATNDAALLKRCEALGVETKRGLRLVVDIVERGALTKARAKEIGASICRANQWMKTSLYKDFIKRVEDVQ